MCEGVAPRKDAVIPGFDQILAHILMMTALLNNYRIVNRADLLREKLLLDEILDIFYPFLEVMQGNLHYQGVGHIGGSNEHG